MGSKCAGVNLKTMRVEKLQVHSFKWLISNFSPCFEHRILLQGAHGLRAGRLLHLPPYTTCEQKPGWACTTTSSCWDKQHKVHCFPCGHSDAASCIYYLKSYLLLLHCFVATVTSPGPIWSKHHSISMSYKTLSSHDAFGICRLIRLKNKWLF